MPCALQSAILLYIKEPEIEEHSHGYRRTNRDGKLDTPLTRADVELLRSKVESTAELDLSSQNLRYIHLTYFDLHAANLRGTDLQRANLRGANLSGADLRGADLSEADLDGADLSYARLEDGEANHGNLHNAKLSYATLRGLNLRGFDLMGLDLRNADLNGIDPGQQPLPLHPSSEDTFFAQPLHSKLTFTRDEASKITGVILRQEEQETPARKV